jgi:subtilase family protein
MKRFFIVTPLLTLVLFVSVTVDCYTQQTKHWIYFKDKGPNEHRLENSTLSPESLARRARTLGRDNIVSLEDMPVYQPYLAALEDLGIKIEAKSHWFNAVSSYLSKKQLLRLAELPFVQTTSPVKSWTPRNSPLPDPVQIHRKSGSTQYELQYGESLEQLEMINVPKVHDVWIDGSQARIGMLDNGFRWRSHESTSLRNVRGEYDFINKDSITANEDGDPFSQDSHGTSTFSVIGGFKEGYLIGSAFNAQFYLAKTEVNGSETSIEEDYWVEGIEWLESIGAEVVSCSLGYDTFQDTTGYTFENGDFDGQTAVTTRAAARAARLGVVVVTATGNEGSSSQNLIVPSDADSIISVGAVNFQNNVSGFSSSGPTNDGRTKPDVVGPGVGIYNAGAGGLSLYYRSNGTSMSTPLVAGVAALVRSANPGLSPIQVREAIRETADNAATPQGRRGWGLVDAWEALLYHGIVFSTNPRVSFEDERTSIATWVLSHDNIGPEPVRLTYSADGGPDVTVDMNFLEQYVGLGAGSGLYSYDLPDTPLGTEIQWYVSGSDIRGSRTSPFDAPQNRFVFHSPTPSFALDQNYPNPFGTVSGTATTIRYELSSEGLVSLELFDLLGRRLSTLFRGWKRQGEHFTTISTADLGAGIYYYQLEFNGERVSRRMVVLN